MISTDFLSSDSLSRYVCYDFVTRLLLKHDSVLPFLVELRFKVAATRNLGVPHVHDATVNIAGGEKMNLINQAADCYVRSLTRCSPFHTVSFHKGTHLFL